MPGTKILFCLLGGKRRVGGAGLLAVDGFELRKGTAHLGGAFTWAMKPFLTA